MNEMQQAAYVMAMAACAQVEAIGMQEANRQAERAGQPIPFDKKSFDNLIDSYGISHNAVISYFHR